MRQCACVRAWTGMAALWLSSLVVCPATRQDLLTMTSLSLEQAAVSNGLGENTFEVRTRPPHLNPNSNPVLDPNPNIYLDA